MHAFIHHIPSFVTVMIIFVREHPFECIWTYFGLTAVTHLGRIARNARPKYSIFWRRPMASSRMNTYTRRNLSATGDGNMAATQRFNQQDSRQRFNPNLSTYSQAFQASRTDLRKS